MKETYQKWYSPTLGRDIEMLVLGHWGYPILLFPTSMGRFYQNKDAGLTESVRWFVESGKIKLYLIDGIDKDSWYAKHLTPAVRAHNHAVYDRFLNEELVPAVLYHSAMPTNLYGPGDNYHPDHSHVLPGLIRRFHEAKLAGLPSVTIWGTGRPLREFLHVDDLADAIIHLCKLENPPDWVNVGTSVDVSILQLAKLVAEAVGYKGEIQTDPSKPDGTPRKLTDTSLIRSTGWAPKISLHEGLQRTYQDFLAESQAGTMRSI